jgi:cytochrome b
MRNNRHHHLPIGALFILALPLAVLLLHVARGIVALSRFAFKSRPRPTVGEQTHQPTVEPAAMEDDAVNVLTKLGDSRQAARTLLAKAKARGPFDRVENLIAAMLAIRAGR